MTSKTSYDQDDHTAIAELLIGRKVTKIADDQLELDDGTTLTLAGHEGGCSCSAGDYELTELSGCDNIITAVELANSPSGDGEEGDGTYRIFVFADNQKINLATFEGDDGNGYYGTGYSITVTRPAKQAQPVHGWTSHGHKCCHQATGPRPDAIARCGGPGLCKTCGPETARMHLLQHKD